MIDQGIDKIISACKNRKLHKTEFWMGNGREREQTNLIELIRATQIGFEGVTGGDGGVRNGRE